LPVPPVRQAVRALIVDSAGRCLLFCAHLEDRSPFWYAPGGGVEAGETDEDALVREVAEETGLAVEVAALLGPVWSRDYIFRWQDRDERHLERFFLIRIGEHTVDISGLDSDEAAIVREYRWWALPDMLSSPEPFSPRRLAQLLAPLLEGRLPQEPVHIGD
jgi:8-oxo-dGTP pyrophosphatase MutT (NUDIX family)